ncbi:MAG: fumarate hydratase [Clostridia bacterium]|nr:fumarate hydratase [Clostridia bacterium]MDE7214853.1 fumarate hydratase [Clostridia bacterium]
MRKINTALIEQKVYEMALKAGVNLTPACKAALLKARDSESREATKFALETLIENSETAAKENMPVCQDTGMSVVYLEIGQDVFLEGKLLFEAVNDGVRRAYADGYFRKSVCDPLTRRNTGDNTPAVIHTEIVAGDKINITYMPKGFGSENMSRLFMLKPAQGIEGAIEAVVETVKLAGSRPCPPVYVGVGIGGTFDTCAWLAKKALMRDVGTPSGNPAVAEIEKLALQKINGLDVGCQGFHGKTTALGVACEVAPTHIAGLPVAVNIQCHCVRCVKEVL